MAARGLGIKASDALSAVVIPSQRVPIPEGLASSPRGDSSTLLTRMRAVLKRHQCTSEEEAVSSCLRQAGSAAMQPSVVTAAGPCSGFINSFRYCQLQTQQHNYPVAPAFLY